MNHLIRTRRTHLRKPRTRKTTLRDYREAKQLKIRVLAYNAAHVSLIDLVTDIGIAEQIIDEMRRAECLST